MAFQFKLNKSKQKRVVTPSKPVFIKRVSGNYRGLFRCSCGNLFEANIGNINKCSIKSCGCFKKSGIWKQKHGHYKGNKASATYKSWQAMHNRCYLKTHDNYKHYGARGIIVCDRWHRFENFLLDMGERPSRMYTIERENNNGNYEPTNCKWIVRQEQNYNKGNTVVIELEGRQISLSEAYQIKKPNIPYNRVHARIVRDKWSIEDAFTIPISTNKHYRSGAKNV